MKTIKSVEYIELDAQTGQVECRVTFVDGDVATFYTDEDLQAVQRQMYRQSRSYTDPLRP